MLGQSNRCREILKKLSLNPNIEDGFIDSNLSLNDYVNEIVRSYQEISNKEFVINLEHYKNPINTDKSVEVIYGLRNFIGNANKFSKKKIEIFLKSNKKNIKDKITKIKLNEAANSINKFCNIGSKKIVKDKAVVQLMRYYELIKELRKHA